MIEIWLAHSVEEADKIRAIFERVDVEYKLEPDGRVMVRREAAEQMHRLLLSVLTEGELEDGTAPSSGLILPPGF